MLFSLDKLSAPGQPVGAELPLQKHASIDKPKQSGH